LEGHGREDLSEGGSLRYRRLFTTVFPVRLDINGHTSPGSALKAVKEQLRRVPQPGIGYGVLRYLTENPTITQQLQSTPQPQVVFKSSGTWIVAILTCLHSSAELLTACIGVT